MSKKMDELNKEIEDLNTKLDELEGGIEVFVTDTNKAVDGVFVEFQKAMSVSTTDGLSSRIDTNQDSISLLQTAVDIFSPSDIQGLKNEVGKNEVLAELLKRLVVEMGGILIDQFSNMVLPEDRQRVTDLKYAIMGLTGEKYKPESKQDSINRGRGIKTDNKL